MRICSMKEQLKLLYTHLKVTFKITISIKQFCGNDLSCYFNEGFNSLTNNAH